ncbi:bifunctional 4-hydroxy-2-oxoglutarate aldolase/2-dehydro-3-deoxy-phosphogluconate aldolase [Thalassotalea sp. PLHSN55]|uniref:bifunctional 4-hydroxy-2-oxoglutarate aldolase/2-dehydro-3-deoxy-phosphogluconate aldolase n=1 Tax=Thalassotalea sp. PLHSN55 TaxID=3435888 RepID=UPI003F863CFC
MKTQRLTRLLAEKLIVIIRVENPEDILAIVQCLHDAGVNAVEVTSNTPNYDVYLPKIKQVFPQMMIGAGTITHGHLAQQAIAAGAEFLVTPNAKADVVKVAHQHDVPVVMGAYTPTDIVDAVDYGADIVKLFPAQPIGPEYLAALAKGPFLDVPFFPVGGIDEDNALAYFHAGAKGIGVGGSLAQPVYSDEQKQALTQRVACLVKQIAKINTH